MKKIITYSIFGIAIAIFINSSFLLGNRIYESEEQSRLLEDVQKTVYTDVPAKLNTYIEEKPSERAVRKNNLYQLYEQNQDLLGWITIDGTIIDYPVVKSLNKPDYYLYKDFNKKKSSFGSIYMDYNCHLNNSKNLILYGHHMRNGSMFASLTKYDDVSYYEEHKTIQFDTLSNLNDYQVVGVFKCSSSDIEKIQNFIGMNTEAAFKDFKLYFEKNKFYDTGIRYTYEDEFLTLMTCEYTYKNGRFFVVCKK